MPQNLMKNFDDEIIKPWYTKNCPTLTDLYDQDREKWRQRSARVSAHIAGLVYIIFSVTDYILVRDLFLPNLAARFSIGLLYMAGAEFLYRRNVRSRIIETYCASATVIAYFVWLLISSQSAQVNNMSYYVTYCIIFMLGQNVFFKFRFSIAACSSTTILFIALTDVVVYRYASFEYFVVMASLLLSTYVLTLSVNWNLNAERYLVFLNSARATIRQNQASERGEALLRLSTTDALTGLANRRAVDGELQAYWQQWLDQRTIFCVILIDVDFFKIYNDCYGHQEGDKCLISVAEAMSHAAIRHGYIVGRFGGEEFIVVAPTRGIGHVQEVAEVIRREVENLKIPHEQRPDGSSIVTVSVGAAIIQDSPGVRVESLITDADRALYDAKRNNRNCIKIFDRNDPARIDAGDDVADALRLALSLDLVTLAYQPILEAGTGKIIGGEALMRLTTPSGKSISPAVFIPMAERTGIIERLGQWALRTACQELLANPNVILVSVNVSPMQLKSPIFPSIVAETLAEFRIEPRRLAIEITESTKIEGQPSIIKSIYDLKALGVELWLDDFGTGFAGLSCVREIQFDYVKIDRSFLHATITPKGEEMFESIINLIRKSGCAIIAEGIETEEQRVLCVRHGVDRLQGYYLGRPISAGLFHELLASSIRAS